MFGVPIGHVSRVTCPRHSQAACLCVAVLEDEWRHSVYKEHDDGDIPHINTINTYDRYLEFH